MSSKFSLLSRAASVAGILALALALPAIAAETAKPVSPSATTPSVTATAPSKQISGDAKTDAKTTGHKVVHAKKKPVIKPVQNVAASTKPPVVPVAPVAPVAKSVTPDAVKTAPAK